MAWGCSKLNLVNFLLLCDVSIICGSLVDVLMFDFFAGDAIKKLFNPDTEVAEDYRF